MSDARESTEFAVTDATSERPQVEEPTLPVTIMAKLKPGVPEPKRANGWSLDIIGRRLRGLGAGGLERARAVRAALPRPTLKLSERTPALMHGARRAGVLVGSGIDKIVQAAQRPSRATSTTIPAAETSEGTSSEAISSPMPEIERDVSTIAVRQAVRRPSIFAPGHILTAVLAGGVIHIISTFAMSSLGNGSAYQRLRTELPTNQMVAMPAPTAAKPILPYLQPDMLYAMCRFDLSGGPVSVHAVLPELGWSLALYTRSGDNFYAAPGSALRSTAIDFALDVASDKLVAFTPGARRTDVDTSQVTSPDREGLVVVRAPIKGVAFERSAMAVLKEARCSQGRR